MEIKEFFNQYPEVAVMFSGGVDSAVLLCLAKRYSKRVKAYFVKSQFQPEFELKDAIEIAEYLSVDIDVLKLDIFEDEIITSNSENRCYFCKKKIISAIKSAAFSDGFSTILDGTNFSDDLTDRPGAKAIEENGVLSPLRLCKYTKSDVRKIAKENGLFVFNKPSYACLATRIETGERITQKVLKTTEDAEGELRNIGLKDFRVRYKNGFAKLEVSKDEFNFFLYNKDRIFKALNKYYDGVLKDVKERQNE